MIAGFTGTRHGMTPAQLAGVGDLLRKLTPERGDHGDCVGSDEQFHDLCIARFVPVVIHPPTDGRYRANCQGAMRVEKPRPYLARDRDIVEGCDLLIATPREDTEPPPQRGQGTWYTVRYSRTVGTARYIVWPDGTVTDA